MIIKQDSNFQLIQHASGADLYYTHAPMFDGHFCVGTVELNEDGTYVVLLCAPSPQEIFHVKEYAKYTNRKAALDVLWQQREYMNFDFWH